MKKALVVAGGIAQAALIKELKERGIYTILADMNPKAVAVPFADKFYPISTMDEEALEKLAVDERVDYVLTACADQVLLVVAKISEKLGLPCYIDYNTAKLVSDKTYMKDMKKSTLRYIESFTIIKNEQEIVFQVTGNGFLHHMVRIMVGTLLEVGRGVRKPDSIADLFGANRADAGELVPACGLCLMEVTY